MELIRNFPSFSILLCMFGGIISSALRGKAAKRINTALILVVMMMQVAVLYYTVKTGTFYVYQMGRFSAPWGNELRAGVLEGFMALFFSIIMFLSMVGGSLERTLDIEEEKQNLYYVLINLLMSSLLALVYTNDLFTAYVFVEINTISACGLIMIRQNGRTIEAAVRYMVMSLLGSGLLLLGICFLYSLTGHLLMSNIKTEVVALAASGEYQAPLMLTIGLMCIGLAIKSALFPFHTWLPDAYGYSTVSSSAILSSLVSKGYIFLLLKLFYRVFGLSVIADSHVTNILFAFGIAGMIIGSIAAIRESEVRRMIAYSSVAQIGYIYMGFGMGTTFGIVASVYHIVCHAATKSLLFIAASGLTESSNNKKDFFSLTGAGYRNRVAGVAFSAGALSMVGLPMFAGFISKILFAEAAVGTPGKMFWAFFALAISTILNAVYFMKTVIRIYTPARYYIDDSGMQTITVKMQAAKAFSMICLIVVNLMLGLNSDPIIRLIETGIDMFS